MTEERKSKGGKDSKKVKRARRHTRGSFAPRLHHKTTPLRKMIHKGQTYEEIVRRQGHSPFEMPFDSTLCRIFALMRAQGLPAPRG